MCGGSDQTPEPKPATFDGTYSAPDLKAVYEQYRTTGQVPYSYYGQGAPANADELARVKAAYPGSFTPNPTPAPAAPAQKPNGFAHLMQILMNLGGKGPEGTSFRDLTKPNLLG